MQLLKRNGGRVLGAAVWMMTGASAWAGGINPEPLKVPGAGSCESVVVVDLDRDGKQDLVSGVPSGALLFYRNEGSVQQPKFGKGVSLKDSKDGGKALKIPHW